MISLYDISDAPSNLYEEQKSTSALKFIMNTLQLLLTLGLSIGFLGTIAYMFIGYTTYIDFASGCYIKVEKDVVKGNRDSIFDALQQIRKNSISEYAAICKNLDTIAEKPCYLANNKNSIINEINADGCYIKGSKTIYIKADASLTQEAIDKRMKLIKKLSAYSIEYWKTH